MVAPAKVRGKEMPTHFLYTSTITPGVEDPDLQDILAPSRRTNTAAGVTGLLPVTDTHFVRLPEGNGTEIDYIEPRIAAYTRHRSMVPRLRRPTAERAGPACNMGFRQLDTGLIHHPAAFEATAERLAGRLSSDALLNVIPGVADDGQPPA